MEAPRPTRTQFQRQLRSLRQDVLRMGALVEQSCWMADQALFSRDLETARCIKSHDKEIDRLYRQIELDCVNLLALQAPVTQDLRLISAFMQLVRDLERIGDYAVDMAEVAVKLFPCPIHPCMDRVQLMSDRCRSMLAMSLAALANLDATSGLDIKAKDDLIDTDYDELYDLLVQTDPVTAVEPIVLLVLVIRYLERMADHATNIGRRVAYIVTGQHY
ncbi:MAG: phosphate signaling complex protein PhoU [Thainema sp.]